MATQFPITAVAASLPVSQIHNSEYGSRSALASVTGRWLHLRNINNTSAHDQQHQGVDSSSDVSESGYNEEAQVCNLH
jgi:hypothetical protein